MVDCKVPVGSKTFVTRFPWHHLVRFDNLSDHEEQRIRLWIRGLFFGDGHKCSIRSGLFFGSSVTFPLLNDLARFFSLLQTVIAPFPAFSVVLVRVRRSDANGPWLNGEVLADRLGVDMSDAPWPESSGRYFGTKDPDRIDEYAVKIHASRQHVQTPCSVCW